MEKHKKLIEIERQLKVEMESIKRLEMKVKELEKRQSHREEGLFISYFFFLFLILFFVFR